MSNLSYRYPTPSYISVIDVFREVLVDIGFGKFLEMVEANFGTFVLKLLLLCIMFAVLTFSVSTIITMGIVPVRSFFVTLDNQTLSSFTAVAGGVIVSGLIGFIGAWIGTKIYFSFIVESASKRNFKNIEKRQDEIDIKIAEAKESLEALDELNIKLKGRGELLLSDLDAFYKKFGNTEDN